MLEQRARAIGKAKGVIAPPDDEAVPPKEEEQDKCGCKRGEPVSEDDAVLEHKNDSRAGDSSDEDTVVLGLPMEW